MIQYNHLNLPQDIEITYGGTSKHINYTYDAAGIKLRKEADGLTTDYIGGFVYKNNVLKYILTDYGKIIPSSSSYTREYNITDHPERSSGQAIGNIRVTFNEAGVVMQAVAKRRFRFCFGKDSYYPFGIACPDFSSGAMNGLSYQNTSYPENLYLYNGKELQSMSRLFRERFRLGLV